MMQLIVVNAPCCNKTQFPYLVISTHDDRHNHVQKDEKDDEEKAAENKGGVVQYHVGLTK
jgi:hypothetical protein